jgi:hypothetical protein
MRPDPTVDEVRRIRHEMSAEYGHDPRRILKYFAAIQDRLKDRLVNLGVPGVSSGSTGIDPDSDRTSARQ